jgi:hypothetical protein
MPVSCDFIAAMMVAADCVPGCERLSRRLVILIDKVRPVVTVGLIVLLFEEI